MTDASRSAAPSGASVHLIPLFLGWYAVDHPAKILRTFTKYIAALQETLSLVFLLKTLFAPWKSIADPWPRNLFDFNKVFETVVFNIVTRAIGAVVRIVTFIVGLVILIVVVVGFVAYLIVWILFPFAFIAGFIATLSLVLFPS